MKTKIFSVKILTFALIFLIIAAPLIQAFPVKNFWYNTLSFLGLIEITNANHLNSDRVAISDIYNEVKELDDIWSETIPDGDYVRITFEKKLTSSNDITIYPRILSGNPKIEIYEKNSDTKIAEFTNINNNQYNKVYLTNLNGTQDIFDLKIINGSVEFDYIIDPTDALRTGEGFNTVAFGAGLDWTSLTNARKPDGLNATIADLDTNEDPTDYLCATSFSFAIPNGTIIDGITVIISRGASTTPDISDVNVSIIKNNASVGIGQANATKWEVARRNSTYGNSTYLWGLTWTPDDINNNNSFGAAISVQTDSNSRVPRVDNFWMSVDYTNDTSAPGVTINQPQNSTLTAPILFNVTVTENTTARECNYTLNSGTVNYTMQKNGNDYGGSTNFNATNTSIADGTYTAKYYCWDMNNNFNGTTTRTFTVSSSTCTYGGSGNWAYC